MGRRAHTDEDSNPLLEQAAAWEWGNLGFEVQFMDGLEDLAYGSGSVHCITKTVRRGRA